MRVIESHIQDRWLFGEPEKECTSCGVVLYTGEIAYQSKPSVLLVEQLDQPENPWGIPAGKTEAFEKDPLETIWREILEETGLTGIVALEQFFTLENDDHTKVKIVYKAPLPQDYMEQLGPWKYAEGIWLANRYKNEIGRIALVPSSMLFVLGHPILTTYYRRTDVLQRLKIIFEGLYIF